MMKADTKYAVYEEYKESGIAWLERIPIHWQVSLLKWRYQVTLGKMLKSNAKWIEDRHLRIVNCDKGATRISRVSPATREALSEHLMGAGELLRSNALTPADLFHHNPSQLRLFMD